MSLPETPVERGSWRGPLRRAVVTVGADGLHRIAFVHRGPLAEPAPTSLPLELPFRPPPTPTPPAFFPERRSTSIPATASEVVARLGTGPSMRLRPAGWVSAGPLPPPAECLALRQQAGLSQRDAARGPVPPVSRGLVTEVEHPAKRRHPAGGPQAERYVAWLRHYVATSAMREVSE